MATEHHKPTFEPFWQEKLTNLFSSSDQAAIYRIRNDLAARLYLASKYRQLQVAYCGSGADWTLLVLTPPGSRHYFIDPAYGENQPFASVETITSTYRPLAKLDIDLTVQGSVAELFFQKGNLTVDVGKGLPSSIDFYADYAQRWEFLVYPGLDIIIAQDIAPTPPAKALDNLRLGGVVMGINNSQNWLYRQKISPDDLDFQEVGREQLSHWFSIDKQVYYPTLKATPKEIIFWQKTRQLTLAEFQALQEYERQNLSRFIENYKHHFQSNPPTKNHLNQVRDLCLLTH